MQSDGGGNPIAQQFDSDSQLICIDTGASWGVDGNLDNFIHLETVNNVEVKGIASGLKVEGIGTVQYSLQTDDGNIVDLFIKDVLYAPECGLTLLCPQQLAQQTGHEGDGFNALSDTGVVAFEGHKVTVPYNRRTRLPMMSTMGGADKFKAHCGQCCHHEEDPFKAANLSCKQTQLLELHYRLGHMGFTKMQSLAKQGYLPKDIAQCKPPICAGC